MKKIYFVLAGNEYGYNIGDHFEIPLLTKERAEDIFSSYLEEYGMAIMYKIQLEQIIVVKEVSNL